MKNKVIEDLRPYTGFEAPLARRQGILALCLTISQLIIVAVGAYYILFGEDRTAKLWIFVFFMWLLLITTGIICILKAKKIQELSDTNDIEDMKRTVRQGIFYVCISFIMSVIVAATLLYYI